jgi:hypothetical protein
MNTKHVPLQHIKFPPEYVGLNDLLFDEPSIVLKETDKKALPLEATVSDVKITPGTSFQQTKYHIVSYPVRIVEGNVDNGKFKGVIRANRYDFGTFEIKLCQLHFCLEKDGKFYAGKSMEFDHDKKHLTAEMFQLKEKQDLKNIGTDYRVKMPLFRGVMHAYFEPGKK